MLTYNSVDKPIDIKIFKFSSNVDNDTFKDYKDKFNELLSNKKTFYVIFDLMKLDNFSLSFFTNQMMYMYSKSKIIKKYLKASVILINESYIPMINFAMKIRKEIVPNLVTSNLEKGIEFLLTHQN